MKSELATYCKQMSPSKSNRTEKITKIVIHHMAGILTAEQCASIFANPKRCASANYLIGKNGEIQCNVDEDFRAWTSGSQWADQRAITIEVSNCSGKPDWAISDKCINSLVKLCADICRRYCINPKFTGDKNGSIVFHCMFQATECPGPFIKRNIQSIITMIDNELCLEQQPVKPIEKPADPKSTKLVKVTAKKLNIRSGPGTSYKIVGCITNQGTYTITEEKGTWGKLKSGAGWIYLKGYTKEVK